MPWVVGIDEAGYGPNLGPLAQAAAGLWLPADDPAGWDTLSGHVRPARGRSDGRLTVDDSKKVYARGGLAALERGVHAALGTAAGSFEAAFRHRLSADCWDGLAAEPWFAPHDLLPVAADVQDIATARERWARCRSACTCVVAARLVSAARFNRIVDESDSKATVLARGLISLLTAMRDLGTACGDDRAAEPLTVFCDKQGGRNRYAALVQAAFPDGWVVVEHEDADEGRYRVDGLARAVTVVFRPRADGASVAVALASMVCKYLREVAMLQFNRFWAGHVPGLAPTAGYPVDAKRFYADIREPLAKLGLEPDAVWRKR